MWKNKLIVLSLIGIWTSLSIAQTPQWGRFEKSFENTKNYNDPYRDVTLNVTYTKPDNSTVQFWGFYDGGSIWKIRFMPDKVGKWKYSATFSDGSPAGNGEFDVVTGDIPGLISADEINPMWFGYKGGKHVFLRGFHVGDRYFASNWENSKRTIFLDWAQSQGYNLFSMASHFLQRDADGRGRGWNVPDLWDNKIRNVKAGEYTKLEALLDDLTDRRIHVWGFAGFFGQSSDAPSNKKINQIRSTIYDTRLPVLDPIGTFFSTLPDQNSRMVAQMT